MKWHKHLLRILFITSVLAACSDRDKDDPTSSTQAANTTAVAPSPSTETLKSDAKEKRSDAAKKRIKGKVQMMTEEVYAGESAQRYGLKTVFKYDENGNQLELSSYKPDGSLMSTIRSFYDAAGKVVRQETVLANGVIYSKSEMKTDEKGNLVEQFDVQQAPGASKLFNYRYIYKYDEKAQEIERVSYQGTGAFNLKYTFTYDANGNRTEFLQLDERNAIIGKFAYKYDDKNNMIEEIKYSPDGTVKEISTFTYEFDKTGNWTRQKKIQNGTVIEVKKRTYKYF